MVEHTHAPDVRIVLRLSDRGGAITDSGRGIRLTPDRGDMLSHAERALTSIYPVAAAHPSVDAALRKLVWGERGSLGPALANAACESLIFRSRRDGSEWSQSYRRGVPLGPAEFVGASDGHGTTIEFSTSTAIDAPAIATFLGLLQAHIPDLDIELR